MVVVIRGCSIARPTQLIRHHGARRLANEAIRGCLHEAGMESTDLDLLINAGVYRERGLGEPALAALVQDDVGANRASNGDGNGHGTFSFDIDNGLCGVLTAVDVVRGFLSSGAIETGIVVASDSGPGPLRARSLPRPEAGAAMLLTRDDTVEGFSAVRLDTYPEFAGLLEGFWAWHDGRRHLPLRSRGGNRLVVRQRHGFLERAVGCAAESTAAFLADQQLLPDDIDLFIGVPGPGFADRLADQLGVPPERTLHPGEQVGAMHSAQPIAALRYALHAGRWPEAGTVLVVCAGSGITVASALYRT